MMRRATLAGLCALAVGCGGGGSNPTPTAPPVVVTPPVQTNRAPSITSMSVTGFGIQSLSQFNYAGAATDPDGDNLTYSWDLAGNAASGTSGTILFSSGGTGTARLTVADGRGGSATDTRTFIVGSMTGSWRGFNTILGTFTMNLTQTAGFITGTYADTSSFGPGRTDPAQPGTIRGDGTIEIRMKQGGFTDFTFRGQMDQTGRRINGGIFGSGFTGQPYVMDKQ